MRFATSVIALLITAPLAAFAQDFPTKNVRIVVPYPPGGGVDNIARPIAERLAQRWGQPVVVENKPGAATIIGTEFVAKAAPDGLTLLVTSDSTITSNPHIYPKLAYDPVKDLAAITQLASLPQMAVAHPSVAAKTLRELVELVRAKPGSLNYGSYGSGSQPHLLYEALKAQTGIDLVQVPYKGIAPAVTATLAGEVQLTMAGASVARGHIQAGKLKPLAIARQERLPILPEVPTLAEAGFPDIDPQSWFGLFATGGTSREIVRKIRDDVAAIVSDPEFRERHMIQRGLDPVLSTPEEFVRFIQADMKQKARLIKISGAKAE
ncbi:MAG: tripartite tricarboxylate transporter substrate binding protein [Burkholderiales bacterium]